MVKFLEVLSLIAAVACVRADGLIGAPAAVYGPPAIRTLEPLSAVLPPVLHTLPHLLPPSRIVTQIVREQVALPLHHVPVFGTLPAPILTPLPAPILPAPILPAPILSAPILPAPILRAPILSAPILTAPILGAPLPALLPGPIPDLLQAPIIPARTYGVPTL